MDLPRSNDGEARFSVYVEGLTSMIGHADRAKPLRDYCLGLMMPCERKSVEPMAAITEPERTAAQHQSLLQIRWACEDGLPRGAVLMDAGYGVDTDLRTSITGLGLSYVAGTQSHTTVWAPGTGPRRPKKWSGQGRPPKLLRRDNKHKPASVKELVLALPRRAWRTIRWREATAEKLSSRFARVRVRVAHRDYWLAAGRPEEWLLIEWPDGEKEPIKYWLSTLPEDVAFRELVDIAKVRWRIERDYQELKQEVGLGHFEGRGWRCFHHHATLCIAAYRNLPYAKVTSPEDPPLPRSELNCNDATEIGGRPRNDALAGRRAEIADFR